MSHTKGPWEVHKTKRGFAILHPLINKDGEYKGKLGGYHVVVQERQLSPEGIETKLDESTAYLIAAAPELLETLKKARGAIAVTIDRLQMEDCSFTRILSDIDATIAKTEGK
jgi:hypothetical protein